ncbi:MAG TPA: hypothetical protein VK509_24805 [Polyangiales bacterium]|nr:hypothetical protein [Polyangiales bacterium]
MPYLDDSAERDSWRAPRGKPVDPGRLWQSVKWDWRWIPIAGVIWGALGAGVAFGLIENTYRSNAAVVWQPKSESRPDERELVAEIGASIKAPAAIGRARELLGLPIALTALTKQVDFQFEPNSRYVLIATEGASPDDAMKLGRVMVRVFLEQQRAFAQQRALGTVAAQERQLGEVQQRLVSARAAYEDFRSKNKLREDELESVEEAAAADSRSDGGVAGAAGPESGVSAAARADLAKLENLRSELAQLKARSPNNPRLPSLAAQVSAMEARVAQRATAAAAATAQPGDKDGTGGKDANPNKHSKLWKYLGSQSGGSPRARGRVDELALGEARRRAELIASALDLRKQIELQQGQVAAVELALARSRSQSTVAHDDWRVLTPPSKPGRPERGTQGLIAVSMPLTGMLVALLALLIRPLVNGRVYTAREAAYWGRLPVLASTAWPRTREMFFPLVDELGQQATGAPGSTLVVGASAAEAKFAEELASWLDEGLIGGRVRPATGTPSGSVPSASAGSGSAHPPLAQVERRAVERKPAPGGGYATGVKAWQGDVDGPALRRAARVVDRVIVLVSSGTMTFGSVGELRTRLGRSSGVALVLLGLNPTLLNLPDQSGEVGRFWRYVRRASARA